MHRGPLQDAWCPFWDNLAGLDPHQGATNGIFLLHAVTHQGVWQAPTHRTPSSKEEIIITDGSKRDEN